MEWLIKRLIKVGARVSYHARRWYVHVASAFSLAYHYRAALTEVRRPPGGRDEGVTERHPLPGECPLPSGPH
jgi:hypothetical protein